MSANQPRTSISPVLSAILAVSIFISISMIQAHTDLVFLATFTMIMIISSSFVMRSLGGEISFNSLLFTILFSFITYDIIFFVLDLTVSFISVIFVSIFAGAITGFVMGALKTVRIKRIKIQADVTRRVERRITGRQVSVASIGIIMILMIPAFFILAPPSAVTPEEEPEEEPDDHHHPPPVTPPPQFVSDSFEINYDLSSDFTFCPYQFKKGSVFLRGDPINLTKQWNGNAVLVAGEAGKTDSKYVQKPSMLYENNTYYMIYQGYSSTNVQYVHIANSTDLNHWDRMNSANAIISPTGTDTFDRTHAGSPSVILYNGTYYCAYHGYSTTTSKWAIGIANSTNLINWQKMNGGNPILSYGAAGKFDETYVFEPCLLEENGTFYLFYGGKSGTVGKIGVAFSTNLTGWTRLNDGNPILDTGPVGKFDSSIAQGPSVVKYNSCWVMTYIGYDGTKYLPGAARSSNLLNWIKLNSNLPILNTSVGKFDSTYILGADLIEIGNYTYLFYDGYDGSTYRIGYAKASYVSSSPNITMNYTVSNSKLTAWTGFKANLTEYPTANVTFSLSADNGISWWWYDNEWKISDQTVVQSSTAATINAYINSFSVVTKAIRVRAFLTCQGVYTPVIHNISILYQRSV